MESMYKGAKRFDRAQLVFMVEAVLSGLESVAMSRLPDVIDHSDWERVGIADAIWTTSETLACMAAQLLDDGVDLDFAMSSADNFGDRLLELCTKAWDDGGRTYRQENRVEGPSRNYFERNGLNTTAAAEAFVDKLFSDYLNGAATFDPIKAITEGKVIMSSGPDQPFDFVIDADDGYYVNRAELPNSILLSVGFNHNGESTLLPMSVNCFEPIRRWARYDPDDIAEAERLHSLLISICRYFNIGGSWDELTPTLQSVHNAIKAGIDYSGWRLISTGVRSDNGCFEHVFSDSKGNAAVWVEGEQVTLTTLEAIREFQEAYEEEEEDESEPPITEE